MASKLYPKGKEKIGTAEIDLVDDAIMVALVDANYVYSASDEFLSAVTESGSPVGDARVGDDQELTGRSFTSGVFDADDPIFPDVAGEGSPPADATQAVIYKQVGSPPDPEQSPLIAHIDSGAGLPVTPNGGDITIAWDNGAAKIFRLKDG